MLPQFPALDANWRETLHAQMRSVVFCWASWSVVHKYYAPIVARVMPHYEAQIAVFTADVDDELLALFCEQTKVATVPLLLLWQESEQMDWLMGYMSEDALRARLDAWLQA